MPNTAAEKRRILVVEDEALIGMSVEQMLNDAGYQVTAVAVSAQEALLAADLSRPELVLMDIHIRGDLDGVEVANRIRAEHGLPIIFVTGHADPATLERARLSEPFGYLLKPITPLSLSSSIEMALYKHEIERKLQEHRAWLSTVLQSIPDAVLVTDLAGNTAFLNPAARRLTGSEHFDPLGQPVTKVLQLVCANYTELAQQLTEQCVECAHEFDLPPKTMLTRCDGAAAIQVSGQVTPSYMGERRAGAVFTLRDESVAATPPRTRERRSGVLAIGQFLAAVARFLLSLTRIHF